MWRIELIEAQVSILLMLAPSWNYYGQKRNYVTLEIADLFEQISWVYMVFSLLTANYSNEWNFNLLLSQILISFIIIWNFLIRDQPGNNKINFGINARKVPNHENAYMQIEADMSEVEFHDNNKYINFPPLHNNSYPKAKGNKILRHFGCI